MTVLEQILGAHNTLIYGPHADGNMTVLTGASPDAVMLTFANTVVETVGMLAAQSGKFGQLTNMHTLKVMPSHEVCGTVASMPPPSGYESVQPTNANVSFGLKNMMTPSTLHGQHI
jgi:hypothetical protein